MVAALNSQCLLCGQKAEAALVILDLVICPSCQEKIMAVNCQSESYDKLLCGLRPLAERILSRAC